MPIIFEDELVSEMPVRNFLDTFLPVNCNRTFGTKLFRGVLSAGKNKKGRMMCYKLSTVINKLMEGFTVKYLSSPETMTSFTSHQLTPDIVAYSRSATSNTHADLDDFSRAELCHHVQEDDIFPPDSKDGYSEEEHDSGGRFSAIDKVSACLLKLYSLQHRTHSFHVFMTANIARLLRVDNSGLVISAPIQLGGNSALLQEFYWRFSHAPPDMRGHDTTIRLATDDEAALAFTSLKKAVKSYKPSSPFYVFDVPDPVRDVDSTTTTSTFSRVVASAPISDVFGRATRACLAYDLDRRKVLFLKDSWRQDDHDHDKESDILRDLNQMKVQYVPVLFAGGDVPGAYQKTVSHSFSSAPWRTGDHAELPAFVHHRLLEEFLPDAVTNVRTAHSLMRSIYESLIAHQQAYEQCGILHRDVSDNNVRLRNGGGAVLSDWDLAIRVKGPDGEDLVASGACQPQRQGTFEFMSSFLSPNPRKVHDLQDDLESFLWLALYVSFRNLPFITEEGSTFEEMIDNVFNHYVRRGKSFSGGVTKRFVLAGTAPCVEGLNFTHHKPLLDWWNAARRPFFLLALHREERRNDPNSAIRVHFPVELLNHSYLISITKDALEQPGWSDVTQESLPKRVVNSLSDADVSLSASTASEKVDELEASAILKASTPVAHSTGSQSTTAQTTEKEDTFQHVQSPATVANNRIATRKSTRSLKNQTAELPESSDQRHAMARRSTKNLKDQTADESQLIAQKQPTPRKSRNLRGGTTNPAPRASKASTSGKKTTAAPREQVKKASTSKLRAVLKSVSRRTRSVAKEEEAPNDSKSDGKNLARKRG